VTTKRRAPTFAQLLAPLALVALAIAAVGCGSDDGGSSGGSAGSGGVTVTDVWMRQPAEGASATAAYGVITNDSDRTVTLLGATSPVSDDVQIHETEMSDDGTMSMHEREGGFAVDAGSTFTLEPGGAHVMLLDVAADDITDPVEITFEFDGADPVTAAATVEPLGTADTDGSGEMDDMDGDMDHGGTDMDDMRSTDDGGTDTTG